MAEQQKKPPRDVERGTTGRQPGRQENAQRGGKEQGRTGGTSGTPRQGQKELDERE